MTAYERKGKFNCHGALDFLRAMLDGLEAMIGDLEATAKKIKKDQLLRYQGLFFLIHTSKTIRGIARRMIEVARHL